MLAFETLLHTLRINKDRLAFTPSFEIADGLIEALDQAGYEIREKGETIVWDGTDRAYKMIAESFPDARLHRKFRRGGYITEGGAWEDTEKPTGVLRFVYGGVAADLRPGSKIRVEGGSFAVLPSDDGNDPL